MATSISTPFPLGVMVGNPNGSDAVAQAAFQAQYDSLVKVLGATPAFMNAFLDANKALTDWASNASWTAWSWRQSASTRTTTPVIGLPMATAADKSNLDAVYKAFASGQYDSILKGIVKAWTDQGYSTLYIRPGYEMNGDYSYPYAGADAQTRKDWVAAFQHISTVLHGVQGADVKVVWNPNIQAGNTGKVTDLYPGNSYVDVIAGDIYNPIYPRDLYDWAKNNGTVDSSFSEWFSNPVNRIHYWNYPAANQWNPVSDGQSNTFSLLDMIAFAKANGKPIAIAETGAGGDGTRAPADDPAFPQWLATTLANAGVPVAFVNIWDLDPGDGNWDFSSANAGKPLEAKAWASYFGTGAIGSGPDTITLQVSEDAYLGDAQFTVSVDGTQIGGIQTATTSHAAGQHQAISVHGTFGTAGHTVAVKFVNDAWGGPGLDRNLYVDSMSYNGTAVPAATANLYSAGTASLGIVTTSTAAADTITFNLTEDAWNGDAQCVLTLDGKQLGGVQTVTARHALGLPQSITFVGSFGTGAHAATVSFINDAYGGSSSTDRNLYLNSITFDGQTVVGASTALYSNGAATLAIPAVTTARAALSSLASVASTTSVDTYLSHT